MVSSPDKPVRPWNLFDGSPRAIGSIPQERYDICKECPFFNKLGKACRKCGCNMVMKTRLEHAKCPEGKW